MSSLIAKTAPAAPPGLDRATVEALAARLGEAYYLLDLDRVAQNYDDLLKAFRKHYSKTTIAYSVKSNYAPFVLALIRELGGMAEVVSELEYEMALRAGFEEREIMVNGPLHEEDFLRRALLGPARVNLDGWYMLEALGRLSRAHPERRFEVGLRLFFPLPEADWSRFGFPVEDSELERLAAFFEAHENCSVVGFHCHYPMSDGSPQSYRARAAGLLRGWRHFRRRFRDSTLSYLDLGGGFRRRPGGATFEEVASAAVGELEAGLDGAEPTLFLEPGNAVVNDAITFVCKVFEVRHRGGQTLAIVNGSNHSINTMMWRKQHPLQVFRTAPEGNETPNASFSVAGNTCMERKDLICEGAPGSIAVGDYLAFGHVGTNSHTLKPPFIHPCAAMAARRDGRYYLAKRRETVDDILRTYRYPSAKGGGELEIESAELQGVEA